jgi:hypothetical protein
VSSRELGSGQDVLAIKARLTVSVTAVLLTPQPLAVAVLHWLQDQTRRSISLTFRMVTLSFGIFPPS